MTTAQVVETSVTGNNNSPIQDYVHPDDQTQPTFEMIPGFKHFTDNETVIQFLCSAPSTDRIINISIVFFSVQVSCNSSLVFTIFFRVKYYVENICLLQ